MLAICFSEWLWWLRYAPDKLDHAMRPLVVMCSWWPKWSHDGQHTNWCSRDISTKVIVCSSWTCLVLAQSCKLYIKLPCSVCAYLSCWTLFCTCDHCARRGLNLTQICKADLYALASLNPYSTRTFLSDYAWHKVHACLIDWMIDCLLV